MSNCRRLWAAMVGFLIVGIALIDTADAQLLRRILGGKPKQESQQQTAPRQPKTKLRAKSEPTATATDAESDASPVVIEDAPAEQRQAFGELLGANWIWSPAHQKDKVPKVDIYFRKVFDLGATEFGQVHICADNQYELFVNGNQVGAGNDWRVMDVHDVAKLLKPGKNVIAVKVTNTDPGPAGLVARVLTKEPAGTYESFSTDSSWRTSVKLFRDWNRAEFPDSEWLPADVYGLLGATLPWGDEVTIAEEGARFVIDPEFAIERLTSDDQTGSLIAMSFNSDGDILASQEGGPLLIVRDRGGDGRFKSISVLSDRVRNVQGILSLGPSVFAVGDGPEGGALYRLRDTNRDGRADDVQAVLRFRGSAGEHGPHAVRLGPDGLLYVMIGNFARVGARPSPHSPYLIEYEGDLVQPRHEDPRGHAVGVPAPGGTVIRTDTSGSFVELLAGGLRNAYDFAFNEEGELFTFDADMEWDLGMPWYRPTRINHIPPGAELGWRSGWAKWPGYYLDSLPALLTLGGGSPTGVEFYDHVMFPVRLHNTLFVGDWGRGLIYAVQLEPDGGSYKAKSAVFLKGRPLNVTDMAVGPDGALYFCTGGRGTDGGIYAVRWKGHVPPQVTNLGEGITRALGQPQLEADWARAKILTVKREMGKNWETRLVAVATNPQFELKQRKRAVDLLTTFGPPPTDGLLTALSQDPEPTLRAQAVRLMGMRDSSALDERLEASLGDGDGIVRRLACEAIARRGQAVPVERLVALLADKDRFVAFAARRALEKRPAAEWQTRILGAEQNRVFLQGAAGLLAAHPSPATAKAILLRCREMLAAGPPAAGSLSESEYLDALRVMQLGLLRGEIAPQEVADLASQLLESYPTTNAPIDRELVKLLAYLQPLEAPRAFAAELAKDIPSVEKLQIAAYAPRLRDGWQTNEKLAFLRYYETARDLEGGYSVSAYLENFARDFFTNLTLAERRQVLAAGESYPTSALSVLAKLPPDIEAVDLAAVRSLDQRLESLSGDVFDRLRVGTVATLGRSRDPESIAYLHEVYRTQPHRRAPVAMSLSQRPDGENWTVLVDSLRTLEGTAARDVLHALTNVGRRPESSDAYRHVILLGLRLGNNGGELATKLLSYWSGESGASAPNIENELAYWQAWYTKTFPDAPPAQLPHESVPNRWSYNELLSFLESEEGRAGDTTQGEVVFREAQCIKCHRVNNVGERLGPDLTTLASRFQRKEVLESIFYPSHVISDQYASRQVLAEGRTYTGIAVRDGENSIVILTTDGDKVRLAASEVEEVRESRLSAMPEGLLNPLSLTQVADLFAFLMDRPTVSVANQGSPASR